MLDRMDQIEKLGDMTDALRSAIRRFVRASSAAHCGNGLFIASLDHSPSEQLDGQTWHTSALILSPAVEHHELAISLGKEINARSGRLQLWGKANKNYRARFLNAFTDLLPQHCVLALCFCSHEDTIARDEALFARGLGIDDRYGRFREGDKDLAKLGPFRRRGGTAKEFIVVPANQALMALFIAYNIRRIRDYMQDEMLGQFPSSPVHVWWQIFSDRPPNNFDGPLSKFMHILITSERSHTESKKFTWGGFTEDKSIEINVLADNLAGAVNALVSREQTLPFRTKPTSDFQLGFFHIEKFA